MNEEPETDNVVKMLEQGVKYKHGKQKETEKIFEPFQSHLVDYPEQN